MSTRIGIDARLIRAYGIGSYVRGLLRGLEALEGGEDYVVFARQGDRSLIPARFEVVEADVEPYTASEPWRMGRIAGRARLDLLHAPHFTLPWTDLPIVTTLFDAIPFHFKLRNPVAFSYIALMMQTAARRAQRILTISHAAGRDLAEALDVDPSRITVVPIGVGEEFFSEGRAATEWAPYFLFVGRVAVHKNIETLLEALSLVRRSDPSVRLVLVGGKHDGRGVAGVVVPGYVSDEELLAIYRGAVAVVMPSFMEGFGLPPLEGMALGTPAITSMAEALVEVTGNAALHVNARSPLELAEAMLALRKDGALRARLALEGRQRARKFTWRACAAATRAVYFEVLSLQSGSR
ncbi:MAG: glycosyltransferase family 1 protein [Acidobacteriota bacterium]